MGALASPFECRAFALVPIRRFREPNWLAAILTMKQPVKVAKVGDKTFQVLGAGFRNPGALWTVRVAM